MIKYFYRFLIDLTNSLYISNVIRFYTTSKISRHLIPSFVKAFNINEHELDKDVKEYHCLHDFFIRTLKAGVRTIDNDPLNVVSPVDGYVEDIGDISQEKNIIVKGQVFSIKEMLGNDEAYNKYDQGIYMIIYLSPRDYHRIHCPASGKIISQWELGGKSFPVNKWGLQYGRAPLAKNFRKISELDCNGKHLAMAKVGALFINSITLTHKGDTVTKGEEIGYFSFGSTVVLLFEKNSFKASENIRGQSIKMGQKIGDFIQQ